MQNPVKMICIFMLGALCNRIRGGALTDFASSRPKLIFFLEKLGLWDRVTQSARFVKDLNAIAYGLLFGSLTNIYWAPIFYLSMRLALSLGWGGYITAIIDRRIDHDRDDVKILDKWFRGDNMPVLSGWAALSLRGLAASIILSVPFCFFTQNWYLIALSGLMMGTIYLLACEICERVTFRGNGWQWGEIVFGGYLWTTIYLAI